MLHSARARAELGAGLAGQRGHPELPGRDVAVLGQEQPLDGGYDGLRDRVAELRVGQPPGVAGCGHVAVLVCAAVVSLKLYQTPEPTNVAVQDRQILATPANPDGEWTLASPVATRVFSTRSLHNSNPSAQTHRAVTTPRYVLDSVPVSYETTFKF